MRLRLIFSEFGLRFVALFAATILVLPLLGVVVRALLGESDSWSHLASTVLPRWSLNTSLLVFLVGTGVLLLGVPPAWLVARYRFPGRRFAEVALVLPLAVPAYISALALGWLLDVAGPVQTALRTYGIGTGAVLPPIRSLGGAALVLSLSLYPYVYLLARKAFLVEGGGAFEIARSLGAGPWRVFSRVALPLARPALVAGVALALMETLAEYGALQLLGVQTWTTAIFRAWFGLGDPVAAARLSCLLLLMVAGLLAAERGARRGRRFGQASAPRHASYESLDRWAGVAALAVALLPPLLGFALPAAVLLHLAWQSAPGADLLAAIRTSFFLALVSSFLILLPVVPIAYCLRGRNREGSGNRGRSLGRAAGRLLGGQWIGSGAAGAVTIGYATPGAVIAVGVVGLFAGSLQLFGAGVSWLFLSFAGLVYAYLVRFASIALETVDAGLVKIRPSLDDVARGLGRTPLQSLISVHMPLLWPSLATASLIVFVEVLKELPATLLIRPFGFETLAVQAWSRASDERIFEAAQPALLILLAGLVPALFLLRATTLRIATRNR